MLRDESHAGESMELASELRMSKVVQLRAAIAPRGFALPQHLNLMSVMRVIVPGPLGWQSSLLIQMTQSPNASLRAIAVFMTMPPDRPRRKQDRWAATLRDGTAFSAMAPFVAARGHRPSINVRYRPRTSGTLTTDQVPSSRSCARGVTAIALLALYSGAGLGRIRLVSARHRRP